jgi:DNA-binding response OmpR family regulator
VRKLLVADDDPAISEAIATFGRARGYEVYIASRGDEALALAKEHRPAVILLDVMMPGLDGRDVMKQLGETGVAKESVVVFVTARDAQSDRLVGLELGAAEYETKPLHFGRLFDKLERLLEKKASGEL